MNLAVEIGYTKQQIALCDQTGNLVKNMREHVALPRGAQDILDWLKARIPVLAGDATIEKAVVGFGGFLESSTGRILTSVQVPGWKDIRLNDWFQTELGLNAQVVNDSACAGYGELMRGAGKDARSMYYLNIGSGIGGGFYPERAWFDGIGYGAAYTGQTYVPDWTRSEPGAFCRLEALCCGPRIEARLNTPGYIPEDSALFGRARVSCADWGAAARAGDAFAISEIERVTGTLAIALANIMALLSPDAIVIGGGVANLGETLFAPLRRQVESLAIETSRGRCAVRASELLDDAVTTGAALLAIAR